MKPVNRENIQVVGGATFLELLTIVFIVLKLLGIISWSWWVVTSPLWFPLIVVVVILIVVAIIVQR